ncbi:IS30 family transposase [uncultured Gemmiger sp.]|uniref:IS30 family transposase n=1 Tax=uncultured Gemmiger sp. TaxID=1623490 RepID=UPI0025EDF87C|nr:IS30 family transposase [uncultured Gemmiger sp.]
MKHKHLAYEDRLVIQQELENSTSLHKIAQRLCKSDSTISREIIRNRYQVKTSANHTALCAHVNVCAMVNLCSADCNRTSCADCAEVCLSPRCPDYQPSHCTRLTKAPHCCNGCPQWAARTCRDVKFRYDAKRAQVVADDLLSESRRDVSLQPEELQYLDDLVSPQLLNRQSVHVVFATSKDKLPCCERTLYNYVDKCLLTARNLDMPRKVRFKTRYKHKTRGANDVEFSKGRTYEDFKAFMESNPDVSVCEMDTVIGRPGGKALLTLIFRSCNLMLAILLERDTQDCVIEALNTLYVTMGAAAFRKLFGVILTDRGTEFRNVYGIEHADNGKARTQVFFCDPYCSWQKGSVEKNHEFICQILPKSTSFDCLTQDAVDLMMSHINSYPRARLHDKSPIEVAEFLMGSQLLTKFDLRKIPAMDIQLRPSLLKKCRISAPKQELLQ